MVVICVYIHGVKIMKKKSSGKVVFYETPCTNGRAVYVVQ